jgi:aspartate kinase
MVNKKKKRNSQSKLKSNGSKTIVIKVGGSCLENGKTIKTIVTKIAFLKSKGVKPIVVVSALKGMTSSLLEVAKNSHPNHDPVAIDKIISEGEQLSARIIKSALEGVGLSALVVELSQPDFPIVTDNQYGNARVILKETEGRIRKMIPPIVNKGKIPIIPGFVGKTKDGVITTMGRGSSDTTAILIGKALKTQEVILLKDVPGILSGDSKYIEKPKKLSKITVEESLNLGIKGGEVLNAVSLLYKPKDVKVRVVNFDKKDPLDGGTIITGEIENKMKVKINKGKKATVTIIGKNMSEIPGLLAGFSKTLFNEGINIFSVSASAFSICFYINSKDQNRAMKVLHKMVLKDKRLTAVALMSNISLITIVGPEFATRPGILGKICTALAKEDINIIDLSTSACEADIFVDWEVRNKAKTTLEELL